MKVFLGPGCDLDWFHSLNRWQHETLAAIYRQGKGLPDRTNHGSDHRWQQAGCKTRGSYGEWRRNGHSRHYHQAVYIERAEGGDWFAICFIRRDSGVFTVADSTASDGSAILVPVDDVWTTVEVWYCTPRGTQSFHPHSDTARRFRRTGVSR